jgi:hypothetical protein
LATSALGPNDASSQPWGGPKRRGTFFFHGNFGEFLYCWTCRSGFFFGLGGEEYSDLEISEFFYNNNFRIDTGGRPFTPLFVLEQRRP